VASPSTIGEQPHDVVLVAVHFQNDVLHPEGKISAGIDREDEHRAALVESASRLMDGARSRGVPVVSARIAGIATHSAVEHTARQAADMGYEVIVAADACAAADPELHAASLRVLALHVERVASVDEILEVLGVVDV
jgi:nicotinamidase-related amidase